MAGNTWVTDMTHFLDVLDPGADVAAPARKLGAFFGQIVHAMTCHPRSHPRDTRLPCRRSRCPGKIRALLEGLVTLRWFCDMCDDQGVISNWRATPWDMTGKPPGQRELPRRPRPPAPPPAPAGPNAYCERLDVPVPRLEDVLAARRLNLREAMIVALLERGGPMTIAELALRLEAAGLEARTGDMAASIRKAWRGLPPVAKDREERYWLDVGAPEATLLPFKLGLKKHAAPAPVTVPERGPDEPLTLDEVEAAFDGRDLHQFGASRKAAAVLDAHGRDMSVAEVQEFLTRLTRAPYPIEIAAETLRLGSPDLVRLADGHLTLNRASAALAATRAAIRKVGRPALLEKARRAQLDAHTAERERRERVEAAEAATFRRALLRVVPGAGDVQAAALLDLQDRSIRTFMGGQLAELAPALAGYDVLVGLHVRDALETVGVDPERFKRLIDLKPPRKTRRLNREGRTLAITPELLITSSTGMSRPLGEPAKIARYLAEGDHGKLERRLAGDLKALFAFYRYGVLQNQVRLRWGFLDDGYSVDWELPGEVSLFDVMKRAGEAGQTVELVVGNAPGWEEPWARARRYRAVGVDFRDVVVQGPEGRIRIPREEVQAVRVIAR